MGHLKSWCAKHSVSHSVELVSTLAQLSGGDLLLLISCSQIVHESIRQAFKKVLVIHASDLPHGRGWSPLVWQIIEDKREIAVSLLEAADPVDSGALWGQRWLKFDGTELFDEINAALFSAEIELMDFAVAQFDCVVPMPQAESGATWYRRRSPEDSRLDPGKTLAEQFDLLRVADPERYPAFFDYRGVRYEIAIRKQESK